MFRGFANLRLQRSLVVLDLEATGTDPAVARIVQIAALKVSPGGRSDLRAMRINPGVSIPAAATAIHGLDDHAVAACPTFATIGARVVAFLEGCDLAGYNIKHFDLPLLAAELTRCGSTLPLHGRAVLDAMQIFFAQEPRDLASALAFFCGERHEGAHAADHDVLATARVLDAELVRYDLPCEVGELHRRFADLDIAGRFRREDWRIVFNFGKFRGRALDEVARTDPDYLRWMLGAGFLEDAKQIVQQALEP